MPLLSPPVAPPEGPPIKVSPLSKLPVKNKVNIIDDYSKKYDFILEGGKTFYRVKGRDNWVDVSDKEDTRQVLLEHINEKNYWRAYSNGEKQMFESRNFSGVMPVQKPPVEQRPRFDAAVPAGIAPASQFRTSGVVHMKIPERPDALVAGVAPTLSFMEPKVAHQVMPPETVKPSVLEVPTKTLSVDIPAKAIPAETPTKTIPIPDDQFDPMYTIKKASEKANSLLQLASNYYERQQALKGKTVEQKAVSKSATSTEMTSYTGDTIPYKAGEKQKYYLPQYLDLSENKFGIRNRGDWTEVKNTPGIVMTNFSTFTPAKDGKFKDDASMIAVDRDGNVKAGTFGEFKGQDVKISKTFSNDVEDFLMAKDGKILVKKPKDKQNSKYRYPVTKTTSGQLGSVNVFVDQRDENTFGAITGGRLIFSSPDGKRQALVSGSSTDIIQKFKDFKKDDKFVRIYSLDNGTYSRGLMKRDKTLSSADLRAYDAQNTTGGTGLYIKEQALDRRGESGADKYKTLTFKMPNIRTDTSASFRAGHAIKNEATAIVLHHTAYENAQMNDLQIRQQYQTPNQNSSHIVIEENGTRQVFATPDQVTFHAGDSSLHGRGNVNDFSVGIEFQGNTLARPLTEAQVESAVEYIIPLLIEKKIKISDIVSHKMISPGRKPDVTDEQWRRVRDAVITKMLSNDETVKKYYAIHYQGNGKEGGPKLATK